MIKRSDSLNRMIAENAGKEDTFDYFAFPGAYSLYYIVDDGGLLCATCANDNKEQCLAENEDAEIEDKDFYDPQWHINDCNINYEDDDMFCDHCYEQLIPEYGD